MERKISKKIKFVRDLLWQYEYLVKESSLSSFIETVAHELAKYIKDESNN